MANIKNPWVGYAQRSYLTIKNRLLSRLGKVVPEMTDHSESNIMVAVLDAFSGVAEVLHYYIDNSARESYISTARRYSSVIKLARLVDYRVKSNYGASADITIEFLDSDNNPVQVAQAFNIPENTEFFTESGLQYLSTESVNVLSTTTSIIVPVQQKTLVSNQNIGTLGNVTNELIELPENYLEGSASITVDGDIYTLQPTLGFSKSTDRHFIVEVSVDKKPYVKFGDGINGFKPTDGFDVIATYHITQGVTGNVNSGLINDSNFDFIIGNIEDIKISNPLAASGGAGFQSLDDLKKAIPLSIRTLDRAVSKQDYIDICNLAPSVAASQIGFSCGDPYVSMYVYPIGGGVAQTSLLNNVEDFMHERVAFPMIVKAFPAGVSTLNIFANVVGKPGKKQQDISDEIKAALEDRYGSNISIIDRNIRESDIISTIDNLPSVDYLKLNNFYVKPFMNPLGHSNSLDASFTILDAPDNVEKFQIFYDTSLDQFSLFRLNSPQSTLVKGVSYEESDGRFNITVPNVTFPSDYFWDFYVYPEGDIELNDFSVPVFNFSNSTFNITETT